MSDQLICAECGRAFSKFLTNTHLKSHGLSAEAYRAKNGPNSTVSDGYRASLVARASGASNPMHGRKQSETARKKISEKKTGSVAWNRGVKITDANMEKLMLGIAEREARYKILGHPRVGWKMTDEQKAKLSAASLGKAHTGEAKAKISAAHLGHHRGLGKRLSQEHREISVAALAKCNRAKSEAAFERKLSLARSFNFSVTSSSSDTWKFVCEKGHVFARHKQMLDQCRLRPDFCPVCNPREWKESKAELEVMAFVRSRVPGLEVKRTRSLIAPLELDVYVPEKKVAIEYCGLYWHSEQAGKDRTYHRRKLELCKERGVRLLTVFEDEWLFRRPVVERMIASALGASKEEKLGARELFVDVTVPSAEARKFCEANHVAGYGRSAARLGLRGGSGALVAFMGFSRPSLAKGQRPGGDEVWEVSRYCTSASVRGGASRLFSAFVGSADPLEVYTYSDLRWGDGAVYGRLGFERLPDTAPGYWYVAAGSKRVHRFALRKGALLEDDPTLSEREQREASGHLRVWDCGHAKWRWIK